MQRASLLLCNSTVGWMTTVKLLFNSIITYVSVYRNRVGGAICMHATTDGKMQLITLTTKDRKPLSRPPAADRIVGA